MGLLLELFGSDKKKFKHDVEHLTAHLSKQRGDLVPITRQEIAELSARPQPGKDYREGWSKYKTGELATVFHERFACYGYRVYHKRFSVLVLTTRLYTFAYAIRPNETMIFIQGEPLASIRSDGSIKDRKGRQIIGRLDLTYPDTPELIIGEQHFGVLHSLQRPAEHHHRAVQIIKELPKGIQELFVAVLGYHIIRRGTELT